MDRTQLAHEINRVCRLHGSFQLRSGQHSDTYFDKFMFESDPRLLRAIADHMRLLVPDNVEVLCGLEMGGIPVVTVLSQVCELPAAFIRKEPKKYGTRKYAEGPSLRGKEILIVEDVVSSGGAIVDAVKMLRNDGIAVDRAVCVIDRRPAGAHALDDIGVILNALFDMDEIESA